MITAATPMSEEQGNRVEVLRLQNKCKEKHLKAFKELIFKAYELEKPKNITADTAKTRSILILCEYNVFLWEQVHVEEKLNS